MATATKIGVGTIKVTNQYDGATQVNIYVPNKDSMVFTLAAKDDTLEVGTTNAGEAFFYLAQASNKLKVEYTASSVGG